MRTITRSLALTSSLFAAACAGSAATGPSAQPLSAAAPSAPAPAATDWLQLFNGKDLTGWRPKIRGFALGENHNDTFRVEDGVIKVAYDKYDAFSDKFGHLFYERPFSSYILRIEYRFVGEQAKGGPGWALRNSGVMLHCQPPETMTADQSFPVSVEVQFLGGNGKDLRSTVNLCTPGTNVVMHGKLHKPHCTGSKSETYHGDRWVTVEVEVHGERAIRHRIDGQTVLEYEQAQYDEDDKDAKPLIKGPDLLIKGGYIALQAESHPIEFRKVELLILPE
jgi:hypothetical protein